MNDDKRVLEALRTMAWERAKGELQSMLQTFWPEYNHHGDKIPNNYENMKKAIEDFVGTVEENEWMN
jgi:hypothetical protein